MTNVAHSLQVNSNCTSLLLPTISTSKQVCDYCAEFISPSTGFLPRFIRALVPMYVMDNFEKMGEILNVNLAVISQSDYFIRDFKEKYCEFVVLSKSESDLQKRVGKIPKYKFLFPSNEPIIEGLTPGKLLANLRASGENTNLYFMPPSNIIKNLDLAADYLISTDWKDLNVEPDVSKSRKMDLGNTLLAAFEGNRLDLILKLENKLPFDIFQTRLVRPSIITNQLNYFTPLADLQGHLFTFFEALLFSYFKLHYQDASKMLKPVENQGITDDSHKARILSLTNLIARRSHPLQPICSNNHAVQMLWSSKLVRGKRPFDNQEEDPRIAKLGLVPESEKESVTFKLDLSNFGLDNTEIVLRSNAITLK